MAVTSLALSWGAPGTLEQAPPRQAVSAPSEPPTCQLGSGTICCATDQAGGHGQTLRLAGAGATGRPGAPLSGPALGSPGRGNPQRISRRKLQGSRPGSQLPGGTSRHVAEGFSA